MAKKRKDAGKAGTVELTEQQLDAASGGIAIIADSDSLSQKVQKVNEVGQKVRLPGGSIRFNKSSPLGS